MDRARMKRREAARSETQLICRVSEHLVVAGRLGRIPFVLNRRISKHRRSETKGRDSTENFPLADEVSRPATKSAFLLSLAYSATRVSLATRKSEQRQDNHGAASTFQAYELAKDFTFFSFTFHRFRFLSFDLLQKSIDTNEQQKSFSLSSHTTSTFLDLLGSSKCSILFLRSSSS